MITDRWLDRKICDLKHNGIVTSKCQWKGLYWGENFTENESEVSFGMNSNWTFPVSDLEPKKMLKCFIQAKDKLFQMREEIKSNENRKYVVSHFNLHFCFNLCSIIRWCQTFFSLWFINYSLRSLRKFKGTITWPEYSSVLISLGHFYLADDVLFQYGPSKKFFWNQIFWVFRVFHFNFYL